MMLLILVFLSIRIKINQKTRKNHNKSKCKWRSREMPQPQEATSISFLPIMHEDVYNIFMYFLLNIEQRKSFFESLAAYMLMDQICG